MSDGKRLDKLSDQQVEDFKRDGFVYVPAEQLWTAEEVAAIVSGVGDMGDWPDKPGEYMKYYEPNRNKDKAGHENEADKILQRVENFLQYNAKLNSLINSDRMIKMLGQLFGEEAILYKEKINYKLPGGDGFKPHQDVAAGWWMYGQTLHISTLISVDSSNSDNGALSLVRGEHKKGIFVEYKEIPKDLCDQWKWEMFATKPGDVVFFDSFVPHASGPNDSNTTRRVIYTTYAKASEGDWREKYYADKRKSFPPDCERLPGQDYQYKI